MMQPLVSICCVTYNHAPFIRQCIDGFLMQETTFPIEILIHDDASTDGTDGILREYVDKYPEKIFPLYEEQNQYSQGVKVDFFNYNRARGKYIAYCEGDDYWTDPLKLQKQVDFMESHPDYSVCFHNYSNYDMETNVILPPKYTSGSSANGGDTDVSFTMVVSSSGCGGKPLTMMFRRSMYSCKWAEQYKYFRDTHEIYHLLRAGLGRYLDFNGAVYRIHGGGVHSSMSNERNLITVRESMIELYLQNKRDRELRSNLVDVLLWNYYSYPKLKAKQNEFSLLSYVRQIPLPVCRACFRIIKRKVKAVGLKPANLS